MRQGACAIRKEPVSFERPLLNFGTFCKHFKSPQSIQAEKNNLSHNISRNGRYLSHFVKIVLILDLAPQLLLQIYCLQPCGVGRASLIPMDEEAEHRHCPQLHHMQDGLQSGGGFQSRRPWWRRQGSPAVGTAVLALGPWAMEQQIPNG